MEQLRVRLEQLVAVESHPVRNVEHRTFNRLMYRNRNQHRHGFYFRKLEHVRRELRKAQHHIAWLSIRNAVTLRSTGKHKSPTAIPLALSSVTHADLKSLQNLYHRLVRTVIPSAAERVTTELVRRSHFLPFAVTVLSILARLHVLENNIFQQLQGALVELELLLFVNKPTTQVQNVSEHNCQQDQKIEDLGTEIDISQPSRVERLSGALTIELKATDANPIQSETATSTADPSSSTPEERVKLPSKTENSRDSQGISLYQKISSEKPIPHLLPNSLTDRAVSIPLLQSNRAHKSGDTSAKKTITCSNEDGVVAPPMAPPASGQKSHQHEIPFDPVHVGNRERGLTIRSEVTVSENENPRANFTPAPASDSSDSEDLDDIFGALDV